MISLSISELENQLWDILGSKREPQFVLLDDSPLLLGAFLRLVAYGHPFFGRARFLCVGSGYEPLQDKLAPAFSLGLLQMEVFEERPSLLEDSIVLCSSPAQATGRAILITDEGEETICSEDYENVKACLSLYGKSLDEFLLPEKVPASPSLRDWHYLGPSLDFRSYDSIKDELILALLKEHKNLYPKEAWPTIHAVLKDEKVSGPDFYHAIRLCYDHPCHLRDMAAYQHDTWCLRTLCFHQNPSAKSSMLVAYPVLLMNELGKLRDLKDEDAYPIDILYSDFLIPLWYVRNLMGLLRA